MGTSPLNNEEKYIEYAMKTITEERDSKQRLPVITWHCSDLEILGYAHALKTSFENQQHGDNMSLFTIWT